MSYRKKTLRRLPTTTRSLAKLITELESTTRRLKNLLSKIQEMESIFEVAQRIRKRQQQEPL
jgi:hypothetical protein